MNVSHGLSDKTVASIHQVLARHPEIEQAILFGSRAKGNFKNGSDIDLTLLGGRLEFQTLSRIDQELDDLSVPYRFSLALQHEIESPEVLDHIARVGVVFYRRDMETQAQPTLR